MPTIATNTIAISTASTPNTPMPCCRLMVLASSLLERAEAAWLAEIEPDEERLADDVLVRHEPPHPAVGRVVAVVAHHEVMPRRDGAGKAVVIVGAILAERELLHERHRRRRVVLDHDSVRMPVDGLDVLLGVGCALVQVLAVGPQLELLAVDRESLVDVRDGVARHADHALDVVDRRILR